MKTTIEISDPHLREARDIAEGEGVMLQAIAERPSPRHADTKSGATLTLGKASFKGEGLQAAVACSSWDKLRDLSYEDRGD